MKDTIKMMLVGMMSFIAIARSCMKTGTRVAHISEPMLMETRYLKNANALEKESENGFSAVKAVKSTKDVADVWEFTEKLTKKDSLKRKVKSVSTTKKMRR
ncbi:hypothetical protein ACN9MN_15255 [Chryseobacterium sp. S-02]|uniref:hypothetical protein n=1 Tax=Chryseobacterium sp. S-02 TaxID=3404064 RepID=UPI003CF150C8